MNANLSNPSPKAGFCAAGLPPWAENAPIEPQTGSNGPSREPSAAEFGLWLAHTQPGLTVADELRADFH